MSASLLNRKQTRLFLLQLRRQLRPFWKSDKVSKSILDRLERGFREHCAREIHRQPSLGKIIR